MTNIRKVILSAALLLAVGGASTQAHAGLTFTGGTTCVPNGTTGFGDLDFDFTGAVGVKAAADNAVSCSIPRGPGSGDTQTMFISYTQTAGKRLSMLVFAKSFTGTQIGLFAPSISTSDGAFMSSLNLPASALPTFGYLSAYATIPGNKQVRIVGFITP